MKFSRLIFLLFLVCVICLSSCVRIEVAENPYDVKQGETDIDNNFSKTDENKKSPDYQSEGGQKLDEENGTNESETDSVVKMIENLSGHLSEGGEYRENADVFARAVMNKNFETVAEYTGGSAEGYGFLEQVKIEDFEIYPFEIPADKVSEYEQESKSYYNEYDMYFVSFDVADGDGEYFTGGRCNYFMGFGQDPIAGGILSEFVPADKAKEHIYTSYSSDFDYTMYFIREFASLYRGDMDDGRNYPEMFDFSDSVHLITHLMARSGFYNEGPPYTLDEINGFITSCFDGNAGLALKDERDYEMWMTGYSAFPDANADEGRLYGCAYAHGASTAEHSIISIESESEDTQTVTVQLFADYAHFAKAKKLAFTFELQDNALPKLMLVVQSDNTGNSIAYVSI